VTRSDPRVSCRRTSIAGDQNGQPPCPTRIGLAWTRRPASAVLAWFLLFVLRRQDDRIGDFARVGAGGVNAQGLECWAMRI